MSTPSSPEPGDVTLFGKKVFADVMKDLEMRTSWIILNPMTSDLITDTQRRGPGRKGGHVKTEAEKKKKQKQRQRSE